MYRFIFIWLITIFSCRQSKLAGTYSSVIDKSGRYENFVIKIDDQNRYKYKRITEGRSTFSQGTIFVRNNEVHFIPDSTLFFGIKVTQYSYDSSLGKKIKLRLHNKIRNEDTLNVSFFGNIGNREWEKIFDNQLLFTPYMDNYTEGGRLVIKVRRENIFVPAPIHDSLLSNVVDLHAHADNANLESEAWNVLDVEINYAFAMFSFTTLPTYIHEKGKLTQKGPVYSLVQKNK